MLKFAPNITTIKRHRRLVIKWGRFCQDVYIPPNTFCRSELICNNVIGNLIFLSSHRHGSCQANAKFTTFFNLKMDARSCNCIYTRPCLIVFANSATSIRNTSYLVEEYTASWSRQTWSLWSLSVASPRMTSPFFDSLRSSFNTSFTCLSVLSRLWTRYSDEPVK